MDFNLEVRLKQLESLEQYISSSRDKVQSILDCLKWNAKDVLKDTHLGKCSVNINHRIHSKNAEEHVEKCQLRSEGYDLSGNFLSEPVLNTSSSVKIDHNKKIEILSAAHRSMPNFKTAWNGQDPDPKTSERFMSTYSSDERLVLYDYSVKNTIGPPELPEFNTMQSVKSDDKSLTYEEMRMRERDAKRRRIKYKSVHTNRKSHKEVIREVIDGQMEMYKEWLIDNGLVPSAEKKENDISTDILEDKSEHEQNFDEQQKSGQGSLNDYSERDHSVVSRNSTHSSSSKGTVRKRSEDRYEYNHHKKYNNDYDYKRHHESNSHDHKRRRSRDRYNRESFGNKYRRMNSSRHTHEDRHRYNNYKRR